MSDHHRKTFSESKKAVLDKELRPVINASDLQSYARQAGFNQVGDGCLELLQGECHGILDDIVRDALLQADANREKSLRGERAIQAIKNNHMVPAGHYE